MNPYVSFVAVISLAFVAACDPRFDQRAKRAEGDSGGHDVPTLRPDLPDATSTGFFLRIDIAAGGPAEEFFAATPAGLVKAETKETEPGTVVQWLVTAEDSGYYNPELFIDTEWVNEQREFNDVSRAIAGINPALAWQQYQLGKRIRFFPAAETDVGDTAGYAFVPAFQPIVHGPATLFLKERYTLSNFVGDYGTGRIVNTFSLLPGETAELRVSTYRDERLSARTTASVLESSSQESFDSFVEALSDDSIVDTIDRSSSTIASFKASGFVVPGAGSGSASANIKSTSNARRDFHRAVSSSVSQTANRASSSRDVYVDTSVETSIDQGREDVSIRTVSNINTGHTLNFISYQMNQEYHSILHLTDVDIGFDDGRGNAYVMPLHQLDQFLEAFVIEAKRNLIRRRILDEIAAITDYRGEPHADFILRRATSIRNPASADAGNDVYNVNPSYMSEFEVAADTAPIRVPGIIVDVQPVVMRTDGVYVEALVGRNSAWDQYTEQLKAKELRD